MNGQQLKIGGPTPQGLWINQQLKKSTELRQAVELRNIAHKRASDPNEKSLVVASCIRAWKEARDSIREIRGRLKPGSRNESVSLKPDKPKRSRVAPPTPIELAKSMDQEPPGEATGT